METEFGQYVTIPQKEYASLLESKADNAMLKDMIKAAAVLSFDGTRLIIDQGTEETLLKSVLKDGYGATVAALKDERK